MLIIEYFLGALAIGLAGWIGETVYARWHSKILGVSTGLVALAVMFVALGPLDDARVWVSCHSAASPAQCASDLDAD